MNLNLTWIKTDGTDTNLRIREVYGVETKVDGMPTVL